MSRKNFSDLLYALIYTYGIRKAIAIFDILLEAMKNKV